MKKKLIKNEKNEKKRKKRKPPTSGSEGSSGNVTDVTHFRSSMGSGQILSILLKCCLSCTVILLQYVFFNAISFP